MSDFDLAIVGGRVPAQVTRARAQTVEDALRRRSKLGLHLHAGEHRALAQFMANQEGGRVAV